MEEPVVVQAPTGDPAPLVFDSPHSGTVLPPDFGHAVPPDLLRWAEDSFVDELFADAPGHGAILIAARFARTYIDPNRRCDEIDPELLDVPWPEPVASSRRVRAGGGLIRRTMGRRRIPVYDRKLTVDEIRDRIARCWQPYHEALAGALDSLHRDWGAVWHVNCHSTGSRWAHHYRRGGEPNVFDFIIGTRDGTTCDPDFTAVVAETLRAMGYNIGIDEGLKGVALVQLHGRPAENRHSLQIEINKRLYMDEHAKEKYDGFAQVRADIGRLTAVLAEFARQAAPATPAAC